MNENPYAADASVDDSPTDFWIDGDYVVLRTGTRLPPRCVFTGVRVDNRKPVTRAVLWRGMSLFSKRCRVRFSVSGPARYRLYATYLALFLLIIGVVMIGFGQLAWNDRSVNLLSVAGGLVIAFGIWLNGRRANFVVGSQKDGWFWVHGFSRQFLARASEEIRRNRASHDSAS